MQNDKIIIVFEYFFIIYKFEKDKLILLQKTKFENFEYDIYKYVKMLEKYQTKSYYSPEIIELSNKSFIIKFLTKEYPTEESPYANLDYPRLIVNIYEYDKITNKYIFKNSVRQSIGVVSRILNTFIIYNGYDDVCIYRNNELKTFIKGSNSVFIATLEFKNYIWKNKYFIFKSYSKIEIYEFDKYYKEKKIKEIEGFFLPMRDFIFYYKTNNPIFFYSNKGIKYDVKLIQYNENFEENEKTINNENKEIIKQIKEMKIINNKIYIMGKDYIYIYILIKD